MRHLNGNRKFNVSLPSSWRQKMVISPSVSSSSEKLFSKLGRIAKRCGIVGAGICIASTFFNVVGYPASVSGQSMSPTLNDPNDLPPEQECDFMQRWRQFLPAFLNDDWIWINCLAARRFTGRSGVTDEVPRGVIIVYVSPKEPDELVVKRVIATQDDVIRNGGRTMVIPKGHCWVEGDNASCSVDSRTYGPVSVGLISGIASHIIFPFRRIRALDQSSKNITRNKNTVIIQKDESNPWWDI